MKAKERMTAKQTVYVNEFTDGILNPGKEMAYAVKGGGRIIANTTPGCWGPMITPALKGGHDVTKPIYVEGAKVGDAIAIWIESIEVTSIATASGNGPSLLFYGQSAVVPNRRTTFKGHRTKVVNRHTTFTNHHV